MTYTEKELDQFLHGISLSLLSKKSAQHWRYDEETAKEIEWLEALERKVRADKADRKTEPQKHDWHDDCNTCRWHDGACTIPCCDYEPKDEPQTDCCETCRHKHDGWDSEACDPCSRANSNYEPQADCSWK